MFSLLLSLIFFQAAPLTSHAAFESVVNLKGGKEVGATIMIAFTATTPGSPITGWIQKHDFFPIENGQVTETGYTFQSTGNTYQINVRTRRFIYNGADGSGDKRLNPMDAIIGRVYKIREETDEGREMTLQTDHGEQTMLVDQEPAMWKHAGPPIEKFHLDRLEEILGKTTTVWRTREGGTYTIEVIEEPEGMDLPARLPKEPKKKKK